MSGREAPLWRTKTSGTAVKDLAQPCSLLWGCFGFAQDAEPIDLDIIYSLVVF